MVLLQRDLGREDVGGAFIIVWHLLNTHTHNTVFMFVISDRIIISIIIMIMIIISSSSSISMNMSISISISIRMFRFGREDVGGATACLRSVHYVRNVLGWLGTRLAQNALIHIKLDYITLNNKSLKLCKYKTLCGRRSCLCNI